jgi:hypothetical protein
MKNKENSHIGNAQNEGNEEIKERGKNLKKNYR